MKLTIEPIETPPVTSPVQVENCAAFDGHEQVLLTRDEVSGLHAIIAVHSTTLGPGLGGCRMWPYASESEAVTDVLRLSRGMSYKHAIADIPRGGGKAVILGDPRRDKTPDLMRAFGRFVDRFEGRYITAEDVGMSVDDMVQVHEQTNHVAGLPIASGGSGDPSPVTAYGVFCGLRAAVAYHRRAQGTEGLEGVTVAVQGLGHVGNALCKNLADAGAKLIVSDINADLVQRACDTWGAVAVDPESILDAEADVFAPCALGAVLTAETIRRLKVSVVAGAANNQLAHPDVGPMLHKQGILYAPDYVINAGGVINISYEGDDYDADRALEHTRRIGDVLTDIFKRADHENTPPTAIADQIARKKLGIAI